jgi:hypothetical protein
VDSNHGDLRVEVRRHHAKSETRRRSSTDAAHALTNGETGSPYPVGASSVTGNRIGIGVVIDSSRSTGSSSGDVPRGRFFRNNDA